MANRYGTDETVFQTITGTLQSDDGSPLITTASSGIDSVFGQAALREIFYTVTNGDFSSPAQAIGTADFISADNSLPYWDFTQVSSPSSGTVGFQSLPDSTTPSGYKLRAIVTAGATTGGTATLTRRFPIGTNGGRDTTLVLTSSFSLSTTPTNTSTRNLGFKTVYYAADGTTAVGTATNVIDTYTGYYGDLGTGVTTWFNQSNVSLPPATASFAEITITNSSSGTDATERYIDIYDVSLFRNAPQFAAYGINDTSKRVVLNASSLTAGTASTGVATQSFTFEMGTAVFEGGQLKEDVNIYGGTVGFSSGGTAAPDVELYRGQSGAAFGVSKPFYLPSYVVKNYDKGGSSDTTTITTAGTYYALTNAEVSFTPDYVGQRFLITLTGYASLNTTTIQYAFVRSNIVNASNVNIVDLGFSRADNFGTSGRGSTVAFTKVWTADAAAARKYKLYGTVQTTNGLVLSLAYTQMQVIPIG